MKRILIFISILVLTMAMSGAVCAEERTTVEAGVKMWFNDWTQDVPGFGSINSDTAVLIGPAINVNFGRSAFLEASYLFSGSNYRFNDPAVAGNTARQDFDLAAGYRIIPEFSLLAGYKDSQFDNHATASKSTVYGPFIGVRADLPMAPYFGFYIGSNYLFTWFKQEGSGGGFSEDSPGWTFESGFKFFITREFIGSFGYKYETNTGNDSNVQDSFSGITLSGMVVF
jgi:hypothetical protein